MVQNAEEAKMENEGLKYSVIVPVYNEEKAIGDFLDRLLEVVKEKPVEVIVVDDGSTDDSSVNLSIYRTEEGVKVVTHAKNLGYGAAIKSGLRQAQAEKVLLIDADGSYPPEKIPLLFDRSESSEMVVAARSSDFGVEAVSRRILKWLIVRLVRWLSGFEIKDLNSGMRLFSKSVALKYLSILPDGFSFTSTLTLSFLSDGYFVDYIDIDYQPRKGESKFRLYELNSLALLLLRTLIYFNPLKFFAPLSLLLILLAAVVSSVSIFVLRKFMDVTASVLLVSAVQVFILGLLADLILRLKR